MYRYVLFYGRLWIYIELPLNWCINYDIIICFGEMDLECDCKEKGRKED